MRSGLKYFWLFSGTTPSGITGTFAATEYPDTIALQGLLSVSGSLAATDQPDSATLSGSLSVTGTLAVTEQQDSFSATAGSVTNITGTIAATEQQDAFTASGTLNISGTLSVTEAQDSFVANASGGIIGSMAAADIADGLYATGTLTVSGTFEAVDTPDALTANGYTGDAQPVLLRFVGLATDAQLVLRRVSDNTVVFSGTPTDGQIEYTALEPLQVSLTSTAAEIAAAVWANNTGAAVATRLAEAWGRLGLDASKPLVTGQTSITFGDIVMAMTGDETSTTVTRQ